MLTTNTDRLDHGNMHQGMYSDYIFTRKFGWRLHRMHSYHHHLCFSGWIWFSQALDLLPAGPKHNSRGDEAHIFRGWVTYLSGNQAVRALTPDSTKSSTGLRHPVFTTKLLMNGLLLPLYWSFYCQYATESIFSTNDFVKLLCRLCQRWSVHMAVTVSWMRSTPNS